MARSKSSAAWLKEHFSDQYVKKAHQEGYRSRAAYKLLEIHQRRKLLKPGMTVIDLGAAPGGWTQVIAELIGTKSKIIASDILPMDHFPGVIFIQGDFAQAQVQLEIVQALDHQKADLILSDISPNTSGHRSVDQLRVMDLVEQVFEFSKQHLKPSGALLTKLFYGEGFDAFLRQVKGQAKSARIYKPSASRSRSAECYLWVEGLAKEERVNQ